MRCWCGTACLRRTPLRMSGSKANILLSRPTIDILGMKMANVRSIRAILFSLLLLLSLSQSGCAVFDTVGGWISQGYDNTVSYFNAYYNAKTLFDDAEAEVLAARSAMKSKSATPFAPTSSYPGSPLLYWVPRIPRFSRFSRVSNEFGPSIVTGLSIFFRVSFDPNSAVKPIFASPTGGLVVEAEIRLGH